MNSWILAIAIMLFMEGLIIGIAPQRWQEIMRELTHLPPSVLRKIGLSLVFCAFLLVLLGRWFDGRL